MFLWGISNVAYSQYSNDPHNPMVVSSGEHNRTNLRIATTSDGTTYIVGSYENLNANEMLMRSAILDIDGNIISNSIILSAPLGIREVNDFNLIASDNNVLLSVGGNLFFTLYSAGDFQLIALNYYSAALVVNPVLPGTSSDINDADEIVFAVPFLQNLYVNKLNSYGDFVSSEGIIIDGFNTMPKVRFIEDGSFYVVYRMYDRLYADLYDKNCDVVWKGVYIGHETGSDLSPEDQHQVIPDGLGGIYVIWKKKNIFVQRIASEDSPAGGKIGVRKFGDYAMALTENTTECHSPIASLDKNTNELNITWRSQNPNTNSVNIQKITPDGEKKWGTNGIIADEGFLAYQNTPVAIGTASDKIMLVFSKFNTTSQKYDLVYNRFYIETGSKEFSNNIDVNTYKYERSSIVSTDFNNNQIVIAWCDSTEDNSVRTLAQNITYNGILGEDTLSIHNENLFDCVVFPVPAKNEINIKIISKTYSIASIQIFDYLGKLIFERNNLELTEGENIFNINKKFPAGEYNILINTEIEKITQTIIVE